MRNNLKLITVILATFAIAFVTSLLLEFTIFKNPIRYALVIMLVLVELYFGFITYKYIITKQE